MADGTSIEWTDATFNPWWGCTKVSPGCDNCYAKRVAARFGTGWGPDAPRREFMEDHWHQPVRWNKRAAASGVRKRVFCASMADVFDKDAPDGAREMLWDLIERTPMLDWQLLTKRIGNAAAMLPRAWATGGMPHNVWLGISVVNQEEADRDIPKLLALPGVAVRFLSCEPLLDAITVFGLDGPIDVPHGDASPLHWVIAGGESGPQARPAHPDWFRSLRDQCAAVDVPFLFKQWGEWAPRETPLDRSVKVGGVMLFDGVATYRIGKRAAGRHLDGRTHDEYPAWPST